MSAESGKESQISISKDPKLDISEENPTNMSQSSSSKQDEAKEMNLPKEKSPTDNETNEANETFLNNFAVESTSNNDDESEKDSKKEKTTEQKEALQKERSERKMLKLVKKQQREQQRKQKLAELKEKRKNVEKTDDKPQLVEGVEWRYSVLEDSFKYISNINKAEDIFGDQKAMKELHNINFTAVMAQANQHVDLMMKGFDYNITIILIDLIDFFNGKIDDYYSGKITKVTI